MVCETGVGVSCGVEINVRVSNVVKLIGCIGTGIGEKYGVGTADGMGVGRGVDKGKGIRNTVL